MWFFLLFLVPFVWWVFKTDDEGGHRWKPGKRLELGWKIAKEHPSWTNEQIDAEINRLWKQPNQ
jgi:hypothetical protein